MMIHVALHPTNVMLVKEIVMKMRIVKEISFVAKTIVLETHLRKMMTVVQILVS